MGDPESVQTSANHFYDIHIICISSKKVVEKEENMENILLIQVNTKTYHHVI